jgi:hypothetical protein
MDVSAGCDCAPSALREGAVENMAIGWRPSRPRSDTLLRISVSSNQDRNSPTTCTSRITRHDEDAANLRSWGIKPETATYSHSIINETCKLLIFNAPEAAPQKFSVIFPVKVRSSSIGEGFRAVRPKLSFRDLSTRANIADNIGARPGRSRNRLTSAGIELIKLLS